ncbi:MAG: DUF4232 domain-containing protein [Actinobacteria bacterium]|nr:DUF4232 domain-containing protein [Actinomycetota bacterium]
MRQCDLKRRTRLALTAAFTIGGACGCANSSSPPRSCAATQMAPELTALGGAASQTIWQLAITNTSRSTCLLQGFLAVYAQDKNRQNIAEAQPVRADEQRAIRLRPGTTAYSRVSFAYYHPDTGELCKDIAWWLRVGLPDNKGMVDVSIGPPPGPDQNPTTFAFCGGLVIGPMKSERVSD